MSPRKNNDPLGAVVVKGAAWTFVGAGTIAILRAINLMILSRILSPNDFGLMSAAMVIMGLATIFGSLGVGPALVQKETLDDKEKKAGHTLSVLFGVIASLAIFSARDSIAVILGISSVAPLLGVLSIAFLLRGFSVASEALVQRDLGFHILARIDAVSYFAGFFCVSVTLALVGAGVWSLVAATIVEAAIRALILTNLKRDELGYIINWQASRRLLDYAGGVTLSRLANYVATQGDYFMVGRLMGADMLGVYSRAYQMIMLPVGLIGTVSQRVLFPTLSRSQGDIDRLKIQYRRSLVLISVLTLPVSVLFVIMAPEIIYVVLGEQWNDAVVPFQILSLGLMFRTTYKISDAVAMAYGRVYERARRQAVYAILIVLGAAIGSLWGLAGVATGVFFAIAGNFCLMAGLVRKITSITWAEIARAHLVPLSVGTVVLIVSIVIVSLMRNLNVYPLLTLIIVLVSLACVLIVASVLFGRFAGQDLLWFISIIEDNSPKSVAKYLRCFFKRARVEQA